MLYAVITASGTPASTSASALTTPTGVAPSASARRVASWTTGPSIKGSENGMPISMASAPAAATARTTSTQSRPRPPVTYGTSSLWPASRRARSVDSIVTASPRAQQAHDLLGILVAATRHGEEHRGPRGDGAGARGAHEPGDRVGGLERRDDALGARQQLERVEHLLVAGRLVRRPARPREAAVPGADPRVVETGRDRVGPEP